MGIEYSLQSYLVYLLAAETLSCMLTSYNRQRHALWGEPNEPTCSIQHHIYILMQYVGIWLAIAT